MEPTHSSTGEKQGLEAGASACPAGAGGRNRTALQPGGHPRTTSVGKPSGGLQVGPLGGVTWSRDCLAWMGFLWSQWRLARPPSADDHSSQVPAHSKANLLCAGPGVSSIPKRTGDLAPCAQLCAPAQECLKLSFLWCPAGTGSVRASTGQPLIFRMHSPAACAGHPGSRTEGASLPTRTVSWQLTQPPVIPRRLQAGRRAAGEQVAGLGTPAGWQVQQEGLKTVRATALLCPKPSHTPTGM